MSWTSLMTDPKILVGTGILVAGVIDDIRSRKVHNWLFLVCLLLSTVTLIISSGLNQIWIGITSAISVFVFSLPLVITKSMGAGDMKLLIALCVLTTWKGSMNILLLSLIWGSVLGLTQILINGELPALMSNIINILTRRSKKQNLNLHKMPYTIALLLGWLSYQTLTPLGWEIL